MNVTARHYASGAENIASAQSIRQRLMNPVTARPALQADTILITFPKAERPHWQKSIAYFDEHVKAWRQFLVSSRSSRYRDYIAMRCVELGVDCKEIIGPSVARHLTGPRQLIWFELRSKFGLSYPRIAREFSDRDHTTIMHGCHRVAKLMGGETVTRVPATERILRDRDLNTVMRADYKAHMTIAAISTKYDLPEKSISAAIKIENWSRDSRARGFDQVNAEPKVHMAQLRREYERGVISIKRLTIDHQISENTIRRLAKKGEWVRAKRGTGP